MSLRVWLPLTKDTRNQGLLNLPIPWDARTRDTGGKLGQYCYSDNAIYHIENEWLGNEWSLACWVKSSSWSQYNDIILCKNTTSSNKTQFYLSIIGGTWLNISCNSSGETLKINYTFDTNIWYHIAATYDGITLKLYLNGNEIGTKAYTSTQETGMNNLGIGCRSTNAAGTSATGGASKRMNDVRIYDHCLSSLEVKQISQGLILHYPLNNNGWGQENLITQVMIDTDPWKSAIQGTYTVDEKTGWILSNNLLYSKSGRGANNIFSGLTYEDNTQYTISFKWRDDYRTDGKESSLYIRFKYSDGTYSQVISSKNYHYWKEEVMTSTVGKTVTAITTTYENGGNLLFTDLKLEKGSMKTSYSPIKNSELYNELGLNDNVEYDTSGYGNNGTKVGTFSYDSDTPKYNVSTKIAASASGIKLTNFSIGNIWSMSVWFKYPSQDNTGWKALVILNNKGSDSDLQFGNYINCSNGRIQYSANGKYDSTSVHAIFGEWNHLVSTYDGTTLRCYFNGEYKTSLIPGQILSNRSNLGVGFKSNAVDFSTFGASMTNGLLSDVRIYATALSADDVKSLYNNSAYIDNQGNIYGAIYEEV